LSLFHHLAVPSAGKQKINKTSFLVMQITKPV